MTPKLLPCLPAPFVRQPASPQDAAATQGTGFLIACMLWAGAVVCIKRYNRSLSRLAQQFGDIRRDPPRLVLRELLGRRSPAGLILEIDIGERVAAVVAHDKHASNSSIDQSGGKRRAESNRRHAPGVLLPSPDKRES